MNLLKISILIAVIFGVYSYFSDNSAEIDKALASSYPVETTNFKINFPYKPTHKVSSKNRNGNTIISERYYAYGDNHSFNMNITKISNGNFNLSLKNLKEQLLKKYNGNLVSSKHISNNGIPGIHIKILKENGKFLSMQEFGIGGVSYRLTVTLQNSEKNKIIESNFLESFYIK